jgi:hypothetical protein
MYATDNILEPTWYAYYTPSPFCLSGPLPYWLLAQKVPGSDEIPDIARLLLSLHHFNSTLTVTG